MEFVLGRLAARARDAALPPHEAARLMEQVARGVHAIHQAGHVHGMLTLDNILLTEDGQAKGAGLRAPDDALAGIGICLGHPSYLAPERAAHPHAPVTPAQDVFALGVILYRLLTGQLPFRGATALDILEQVRKK